MLHRWSKTFQETMLHLVRGGPWSLVFPEGTKVWRCWSCKKKKTNPKPAGPDPSVLFRIITNDASDHAWICSSSNVFFFFFFGGGGGGGGEGGGAGCQTLVVPAPGAICQEVRSIVVLAPCGHSLCQPCQDMGGQPRAVNMIPKTKSGLLKVHSMHHCTPVEFDENLCRASL